MGKNITVSEKYGVNPSLEVCFWCNQETGTVLMLGRLPGDREAPHRSVTSYEPCQACKDKARDGVWFIEVTESNPDEVPPIGKRSPAVYPTGRHVVVKKEAVVDVLSPDVTASVLETGKALIPIDVFSALFVHELEGE